MVRREIVRDPGQEQAIKGVDAAAAEEHGEIADCVVGGAAHDYVAHDYGDGEEGYYDGALAEVV